MNQEYIENLIEKLNHNLSEATDGGFEAILVQRTCDLLPNSGDEDGIPKKNAWIVWILNKSGKINDLQVYELDPLLPERWKKTVDRVTDITKITRMYDCGRVNSDWDEWKLQDVLFKFGFQYQFESKLVMKQSLQRLATIEEFKENIERWMQIYHI